MNEVVNITSTEVGAAADVLEKLSTIYGLDARLGEWCAEDLRAELPHIQDYEIQQHFRRKIAEAVVEQVFTGLDVNDAVCQVLSNYEIRLEM